MKIAIADSNELIRLGLRVLLNTELQITIVGEANRSCELLELLGAFDVDVVIIDFTSSGFDINDLSQIKRNFPNVGILAVTPDQSAQVLVDALRSGITSYVKKDCSFPEIIEAVNETKNGNMFFCGQILETISEANLDVEDIDIDAFSCEAVVISKREGEIITFIAEGYTNTQIAEKLFLSAHTINTHRKNIMSKLGVKNTAGIVMYAVKSNLISPNKFLFTSESDN
ncbi:MAG: response regulator transcription factor [Crocinitomicaceae bacterium]|nr:response regulator transcription factor [Crocinitomicaceae bacterium]